MGGDALAPPPIAANQTRETRLQHSEQPAAAYHHSSSESAAAVCLEYFGADVARPLRLRRPPVQPVKSCEHSGRCVEFGAKWMIIKDST